MSAANENFPGAETTGGQDPARQWRPGSFALRDAWFPVAHAPLVTVAGIQAEVHRQPIHLWRDGARIRATEFPRGLFESGRPPGSEFTGGSGEYPLIERYGYAWVWYGNPEHAEDGLMPDVPYLPREGKLPRHMWGTVVFDCTYELTCENLLDLTHADFLHGKLIGESYSEDDRITVESTSETICMVRETKGRITPAAQKPLITTAKYQDMRATTFIHLRSGVTILYGEYTPGITVQLFHPDVPVSPTRTHNNYTFNPKGANALARNLFPFSAQFIGAQDNRMLKVQNPRYLQDSERTDFSSRFDSAGLTYRRRFKALVERQQRGDYSYQSDCDPGADLSQLLGIERVG